MVDENPLSIIDQLIIASLFIPVGLTALTLTLFVMVLFCTILIAPFGTIATIIDRRRGTHMGRPLEMVTE